MINNDRFLLKKTFETKFKATKEATTTSFSSDFLTNE